MITYTVKPGDMIGVLAVKYKTTIRILMNDNPFIGSDQKLQPGWRLSIYEPAENAKRHSETAYEQIEKVHQLKSSLENNQYMLSTPRAPLYYKERLVLEGQIGFVKTKDNVELMEIQSNGYEKTIRVLPKGEILRVYEVLTLQGQTTYLVDGYRWITADSDRVLYEEIPLENIDGKIRIKKQESVFGIQSLVSASATTTNTQSNNLFQVTPQTFVGAGPQPVYKEQNTTTNLMSNPFFVRPNYKRPVMQLRNAAGETTNIELRVLGFNASYSNNIQPATTNAGWMVNIRAHNLPVLNISGFLLETKDSNEFDSFMSRYHKYLAAKKTDDYYALGISTLFYKQTEYRGVVTAFSYSDQEEQTFHRKYTLQMLVLKEKSLSASEIAKIPTVASRKGLSESNFRSSIASMLANPITGQQYTDNY